MPRFHLPQNMERISVLCTFSWRTRVMFPGWDVHGHPALALQPCHCGSAPWHLRDMEKQQLLWASSPLTHSPQRCGHCEQWGPCPSSPSCWCEEGDKAFGLREDKCLSQILIIQRSDHVWSLNRTESAAVLGTRSKSPSVHKWLQIPEQKFKACFWPQGQFKSATLTFLDWNILDQKQSLKPI